MPDIALCAIALAVILAGIVALACTAVIIDKRNAGRDLRDSQIRRNSDAGKPDNSRE